MLTTLFRRTCAAHLSANQLRSRYVLALSLIACMTIASQLVIQFVIADRENDSHIVNVAGRQRMLSQTIAKTSALLAGAKSMDEEFGLREQLERNLTVWERAHRGLLQGDSELQLPGNNSNAVMALFEPIQSPFADIVAAAKTILTISTYSPDFDKAVRTIQERETVFLKGMEDIVSFYDQEARNRITLFRWLELGFLGATLAVLLLEAAFIFAPATRRMEHDLKELTNREEDLESLFAVSPTALLLVDSQTMTVLFANQRAAKLIGLSNAELIKSTLYDHLDDHYDANRRFLEKVLNDEFLNEYEVVRLDAKRSVFETLVSVRPLIFSNRSAFVLGITNVAELKKAQDTLEFFAAFDEVSRLMNPSVGLLMLKKSMERSKRSGEQLAVCFADLDGIMAVNDQFGRAEGDWLIHTVAQLLTEVVEPSDIVIRLGGDEFLLVLHNCSPQGADFLMFLAEDRLLEIETKEQKPYQLRLSFGAVAYAPDQHATADELISKADALMYRTKQEKKQRMKRLHGNLHVALEKLPGCYPCTA